MVCKNFGVEVRGRHYYCYNCGSELGLQGWIMSGGNPQRTSFIDEVDFEIQEFKKIKIACQIQPLLLGENLITFEKDNKLKSYLLEELYEGFIKPVWEIDFNANIHFYNSPVYSKSHLYLLVEGKIINVNLNTGKFIYSEIKTPRGESLLDILPTASPLITNIDEDIYIIFGLKGSFLIIHINKYNKTTIKFEQLENKELILRNPVLWNNKVLFISSIGTSFVYDLITKDIIDP